MPSSWFEPLPARATYQAEAHAENRAALAEAAAAACARTAPTLLAMQKPEGYWVGDLLADSTLESDYVLLQLWLHPPRDGEWKPPTWDRIQRARKAILARQKSDGGFNIYPDGPADVNATIKGYIALKLAGLGVHSEPLQRARDAILNLGGLQEANSYVRINLSLFGLYPKRHVPTIPVELALVPGGLIYEMSSWTRAIVMPLTIIQAKTDTRPVPAGFTLDELVVPGKSFKLPKRDRLSALFRQLDIALKMWATRGPEMIRRPAIREAEKWVLDHTRNSDGLGAIYPSMMYLIMALDALGYPRDHPDLIEAIRQYEGLLTETPEAFYFQPCVSPVWDTAIAMFALGEMGAVAPAAMRRGADWFIAKEIRRRGDWSVKRPDLEPSGWAFEFANEHYPDIDDTAMVLLAMQHAQASDAAAQERCERRAVAWLVGMQSGDGGWAAFDADNNWAFLNRVPFADHNAMLDPSCPDITGRVLEALCRRGFKLSDPADREGRGVPPRDAGARRELVRALGRELSLRHLPRPARPPGRPGSRRLEGGVEGGEVDRLGAERGRGLGRELRELQRGPLRARAEHPVADRVGAARPDRGRPGRHRGARPRRPASRGHPEARRDLGRAPGHRHRLPQRVLPALHALPELFPAARADPGPPRHRRGGARPAPRAGRGPVAPAALSGPG